MRQYEPWFLWLTLDEIVWLLYDVADDRYQVQLDFYRRAAARRAEAWEEEERYWARKRGRPARSIGELEGRPSPVRVSTTTAFRPSPVGVRGSVRRLTAQAVAVPPAPRLGGYAERVGDVVRLATLTAFRPTPLVSRIATVSAFRPTERPAGRAPVAVRK